MKRLPLGSQPPALLPADAEGPEPRPSPSQHDDAMPETTLLGELAAAPVEREPWYGAPENYEPFQLPAEIRLEPSLLDLFHGRARDMNLSQAAAQSLIDVHLECLQAYRRAQHEAAALQQEEWLEAVRSDAEIGGPRLAENLGFAAEAIRRLGSPALRDILNESGLGNHPEVVRFFVRAGMALGEGRYVAGGYRNPRTAAQVLYPTMS
jgi:hypothetical protein